VLTHFHLDHVIGLFYLGGVDLPVTVWAGGDVLEGLSTESLLRRLLGPPFAPGSFLDGFAGTRELATGTTLVEGFAVTTRIQRLHSNPTLALRVDDAVVWCTDTEYDPGNVDFARGARVLFHEAFAPERTHTAARQAAELAAAADVERLVVVHVNPAEPDENAVLTAARAIFPATVLGEDGLVVEVA
jgi:ribonuclease BN (tRNA processing enzyme)